MGRVRLATRGPKPLARLNDIIHKRYLLSVPVDECRLLLL